MTEADLAAVANIEKQVFSDPWSVGSFRSALRGSGVAGFVVPADGAIDGYGICRAAADEGEILNLAVRPERRHRGLGRELATAMLDWMAGQGALQVYLEVRSSNAAAIGLYRALGFAIHGVRKDYYQSPREDAVIMKRDRADRPAG
ncbi:MAG TPA: ribosomal protein S18-alanine N-acetyltransferase [Gemmatimonadales bacterium]|nr:ribosomal protein S18-alanine N-acetyltransferase [Gemmatimonadales bacterium]